MQPFSGVGTAAGGRSLSALCRMPVEPDVRDPESPGRQRHAAYLRQVRPACRCTAIPANRLERFTAVRVTLACHRRAPLRRAQLGVVSPIPSFRNRIENRRTPSRHADPSAARRHSGMVSSSFAMTLLGCQSAQHRARRAHDLNCSIAALVPGGRGRLRQGGTTPPDARVPCRRLRQRPVRAPVACCPRTLGTGFRLQRVADRVGLGSQHRSASLYRRRNGRRPELARLRPAFADPSAVSHAALSRDRTESASRPRVRDAANHFRWQISRGSREQYSPHHIRP